MRSISISWFHDFSTFKVILFHFDFSLFRFLYFLCLYLSRLLVFSKSRFFEFSSFLFLDFSIPWTWYLVFSKSLTIWFLCFSILDYSNSQFLKLSNSRILDFSANWFLYTVFLFSTFQILFKLLDFSVSQFLDFSYS